MKEVKQKTCCFSKYMKFLKKNNVVNVINLEGIIGQIGLKQGLTISSLNKHIEKAFEGKNIKAVVININSPGGSPVQSELISKRIVQLSKQKEIPVIAVIEDIAASGGYWLACSASEIIAAENALLGNLGVKFSGFGFNKVIENFGIDRRVYTQGDSKALLDPFLPEKPEDVKMILKVQSYVYENFKKQVHFGREGKLKIEDTELFSGAIWSGRQALEIGLVDKIGDLYSEMQERFGLEVEINIVNQEKSWFKKKLGLTLDFLVQNLTNSIMNFVSKKIELR